MSQTAIELTIEGMSCQHCVERVRASLEALDGVRVLEVQIGSARVETNPDSTDRDRLRTAVEEAGFRVS